MSDSKNNSPGNDYEEVVISDRRSITSEEEEDSEYEVDEQQNQFYSQKINFQAQHLQNQQDYDIASNQESNMKYSEEKEGTNMHEKEAYQKKDGHFESNIEKQKIDLEHVKQRFSQYDMREGNNTPNSPSYLVFAPDQLKLNQYNGNEKVEKHLLKTLEEFSPISRMEDSRGDMTAQIFDLSMVQGRDQHLGSNLNIQGSYSSKNIKSTFSSLANANQNRDYNKNGAQTSYSSLQQPNAPLPPTLTRLSNNSKQEQKTQKLRERLEKYSHQMMNNINLQKSPNNDGAQLKQNSKNQIVQQKNSSSNLLQSKKGSSKNSKISTPIAKKGNVNNNMQFEAVCEQRREKSSNSYSKPTLSSSKKNEQSKTERNTPSNVSKQNQAASSSSKIKQSLQQSIQQQQQITIQIQKKMSQPINSVDKIQQKKLQNLVQAKHLLTSPLKSKIQQNNFLANQPTQRQSQPSVIDLNNNKMRDIPPARYSDIICINQSNKQKSSSPSNRVRTATCETNKQSLPKNYMSEKQNQRKNFENANNQSLKKSYSQENVNLERKNSQMKHQQVINDQNHLDDKKKLDLISLRQLYRDSMDNYFVRQNQNQTSDVQKGEEEGDEFEINIYKNQSEKFSPLKNQKRQEDEQVEEDDEEEEEQIDFPQLYHFNRSQSQYHKQSSQEKDGKNNSQNVMRRSYTQDNMLNSIIPNSSQYKGKDQSSQQQNKDLGIGNQNSNSRDNIQQTKEVTESSFNQSTSHYYKLDNFQEQKSNPKNTPFHNNNNQQLTGDSNFTSYTNALSVVTNQGQKVISSAKYIDQDEDEIIDNNEQYFLSQRATESQNKKRDDDQQVDLKNYNVPPKQRKASTNYNPRESPNRQSQSTPKTQKQTQQNTSNNNHHIDLRKNNNYFNPLSNEKPTSQRYSDQIDVRNKTEAANKTNANCSNSSLNLNNPICLYNLHKENSNKSTKNGNPHLNQHYYSLKESQNQSNPRKQNEKQQSPFSEESPVKFVNKNQILNDLKRQAQNLQKQIIDISQKSKRGTNTQSIHSIDKYNQNSYSYQTQRSQPVLPSDSQVGSQTHITTKNQQQLKNNQNQHQSNNNINQKTPNNSNLTTSQQFYQQSSQYQQLFQQKQAGRIYSQRDATNKKQKYMRNSSDFKNQQGQGDQMSMNNGLSENIMKKLYPDQKKNISKSKDQLKQNSKTSNSIYDTNIDYILKLLKESSTIQQQNSMIQSKNNQNNSFNMINNKNIINQQLKLNQQQQPNSQPKSPSKTSPPLVKEQFSKYLQIVQKKVQRSPQAKHGQVVNQKEQIAQRIQQIESEIPKIQSQKNQIAIENNILEQQNQLLKQNLLSN